MIVPVTYLAGNRCQCQIFDADDIAVGRWQAWTSPSTRLERAGSLDGLPDLIGLKIASTVSYTFISSARSRITFINGDRRRMPLEILMIIPDTPARLILDSACCYKPGNRNFKRHRTPQETT